MNGMKLVQTALHHAWIAAVVVIAATLAGITTAELVNVAEIGNKLQVMAWTAAHAFVLRFVQVYVEGLTRGSDVVVEPHMAAKSMRGALRARKKHSS
jgi:hypothetical protein